MRLRKLWLRHRLKRLEARHRENDTWKATPSLLMEIAFLLSPSHLNGFTVEEGSRIQVTCGFRNAEDTVRVLRRIALRLKSLDVIEDRDAGLYKQPVTQTLAQFLRTEDDEPVNIKEFHRALRYVMADVVAFYNHALTEPQLRGYYQRAMGGVCKDLFTIVEALLLAATSLEPSPR